MPVHLVHRLGLVGDLVAVLVAPGRIWVAILVVESFLHRGLLVGDLGGVLGNG